jgi:outer membrane immunogenic protein
LDRSKIGANFGGGAVVNDIEIAFIGNLDFNGIGGEGVVGSIMVGYNNLKTEFDISVGGITLDAQQGLVASISTRSGLLITLRQS